jgi:hypothetical protein
MIIKLPNYFNISALKAVNILQILDYKYSNGSKIFHFNMPY